MGASKVKVLGPASGLLRSVLEIYICNKLPGDPYALSVGEPLCRRPQSKFCHLITELRPETVLLKLAAGKGQL